MPQQFLDKLIDLIQKNNASDLHLVPGYPPTIRVKGRLTPLGQTAIPAKTVEEIARTLLGDDFRQFQKEKDFDSAYNWKNKLRFRVNAYYTMGNVALALRVIPNRIKTLQELNLPTSLGELALQKEQGLVLVVGPTGHGKSTTIASMINLINRTHKKHIVTLEDPIEYVFPKHLSIVSQREIDKDAIQFHTSLRNVLREDPDVVFIGEMRDAQTIEAAITVAETGHLVFSTLHTYSASQTIERIVQSFSEDKQDTIRTQLAYILEAVISQRLIPTKDGKIYPALELLLINPAVRNLIRETKFYQIDNVIKTSLSEGMFPLEYSIAKLVKQGLLDQEEAKRYAVYPDEIKYWLTT